MRVGFVAPSLTPTHGWGRYTLELVGALAATEGHDFEALVITSADSPTNCGAPHVPCYPILPSLPSSRRWLTVRVMRQIPAVRRLTRACALVHCTAEPFIPLGVGSRRPHVMTAHGSHLPGAVQRRWIGRLFAHVALRATVVCVSAHTESVVRACLPGARTVVVHNGVNWRWFAEPDGAPEPMPGPVILGVGQVKARKGFQVVAQAMQIVRSAYRDATYVIIGDTSVDPKLAARLRATPGVRLLGRVSDEALRGWYHQADLFALTPVTVGGKFEGFGLVYLEAGAAGVPAVAACGSGAEEAVVHNESGLLVPQNDPEATAAAILRLLDDAALRARLGEGARRRAQAHGWERVAARMLDVYRAALEAG